MTNLTPISQSHSQVIVDSEPGYGWAGWSIDGPEFSDAKSVSALIYGWTDLVSDSLVSSKNREPTRMRFTAEEWSSSRRINSELIEFVEIDENIIFFSGTLADSSPEIHWFEHALEIYQPDHYLGTYQPDHYLGTYQPDHYLEIYQPDHYLEIYQPDHYLGTYQPDHSHENYWVAESRFAIQAPEVFKPDLQEALQDLEGIVSEATEEGYCEPTSAAIENARSLVLKMYQIAPHRYDVYPMADGEIVIDGGKPDRRLCVFCYPDGHVLCLGWIDGERQRLRAGSADDVQLVFLEQSLRESSD